MADTKSKEMDAIRTAELNMFFVGNPGCGKSTLANAVAGELCFKSGTSVGGGLTSQLDVFIKGGLVFVDTPGLSDAKLRKEAAEAISTALKAGGKFKVMFTVKQDAGRVRTSDITTIQMVLDACEEIGSDRFSIIVNMCSKPIMKLFSDKSKFDQFNAVMQESLARKTGFVFFLPRAEDFEDENDLLVPMDQLRGLKEFLETAPMIDLTPGKAKDVQADLFEALEQKMEEKDRQIKELMEQAKQDNEEAKAAIRDMQANFQQQLEEVRRQPPQNNVNPWELLLHAVPGYSLVKATSQYFAG